MHRDGVKVMSVPALFGCSIDRQFCPYKDLIVVILKTFLNFYFPPCLHLIDKIYQVQVVIISILRCISAWPAATMCAVAKLQFHKPALIQLLLRVVIVFRTSQLYENAYLLLLIVLLSLPKRETRPAFGQSALLTLFQTRQASSFVPGVWSHRKYSTPGNMAPLGQVK